MTASALKVAKFANYVATASGASQSDGAQQQPGGKPERSENEMVNLRIIDEKGQTVEVDELTEAGIEHLLPQCERMKEELKEERYRRFESKHEPA